MADQLYSHEEHQEFDEVMRVLRSAVREAQEESRRLGVPNVYSFGGQIYYELPNGEYTRTRPTPAETAVDNSASDSDDQCDANQMES